MLEDLSSVWFSAIIYIHPFLLHYSSSLPAMPWLFLSTVPYCPPAPGAFTPTPVPKEEQRMALTAWWELVGSFLCPKPQCSTNAGTWLEQVWCPDGKAHVLHCRQQRWMSARALIMHRLLITAFILYQCMSWSLPFSKLVSHHNSPKLTKLSHLEELAVLGWAWTALQFFSLSL